MASLRSEPRGRSPYWFACITLPGGKQTQRSTKVEASERNRAQAMALAEKWEREINLLAPAKHLENRDGILESFIRATQQAVQGNLTEAGAREVLDQLLEATGQRTLKVSSVREFTARWLEAGALSTSEGTQISYRHAVRLLLEGLGPLADQTMRNVTTDQIEAFKQSSINAGKAAKTVDRDLKVIRALFRVALNQGQITFDPTQAVPLVSRKSKALSQKVSKEIILPAEAESILRVAEGDWLTAVLIGRYTGARLGDCVKMRWENIDWAGDRLCYTDQKTNKDYIIPLHHRLRSRLQFQLPFAKGQDYICPSLAEMKSGGCNGLSRQFIKIMRRAGLDERAVPTKALKSIAGKNRTLSKKSFHSLRHTYNTDLANADVPQEIRRKLVGHTSDEMNDLYTQLDVKVFRSAIRLYWR